MVVRKKDNHSDTYMIDKELIIDSKDREPIVEPQEEQEKDW